MKLFQTILRWLPSTCSHAHTYRERRKLHGVQVMHLVCERCGHATPVVERTAREHRRAVQAGDHVTARLVRPQHGQVVTMDARQRRKPA
jgi:hypothetical protein